MKDSKSIVSTSVMNCVFISIRKLVKAVFLDVINVRILRKTRKGVRKDYYLRQKFMHMSSMRFNVSGYMYISFELHEDAM